MPDGQSKFTPAPPSSLSPTEPNADMVFWLAVRRGLLMITAAIEKRWGLRRER